MTVSRSDWSRISARRCLFPQHVEVARSTYEMAEQLFKQATRGKTLHRLRHSRLTHLGDQNVSAPLLMAISGHKQLAILHRSNADLVVARPVSGAFRPHLRWRENVIMPRSTVLSFKGQDVQWKSIVWPGLIGVVRFSPTLMSLKRE